jgi:hypothetical protein
MHCVFSSQFMSVLVILRESGWYICTRGQLHLLTLNGLGAGFENFVKLLEISVINYMSLTFNP